MKRLLSSVAIVSVGFLAACQDLQQPPASFDVQDGSEFGGFGNPHFFFLPPLVPSPEYFGTFDATLLPYLRVEVTGPFADESAATCDVTPYDILDQTDGLSVDAVNERYAIGWNDNALEQDKVYRLCVHLQPAATFDATLGFRDVQPTQGGGGVAEDPVYLFNNGSNLAIKFRVEEGVLSAELCTGDGTGYDCTAQVLMNNETAICDNATCSLSTPENGLAEPVLFLIERVDNSACVDGVTGYADWLGVDIPQYAGCMQVTVFDPDWDGFINDELAIVATCPDLSTGPPLTSAAQDESMQLHIEYDPGVVEALPPRFSAIDNDCVDPDPDPPLAPGASLATRLGWVAQTGWRRIRNAVAGAFTPTTAYAFHTGFGGHTKLAPPDDGGEPGGSPSGEASLLVSEPSVSFNTTSNFLENGLIVYRLAWALPSQMEKVTPLEKVIGNVNDVVPVEILVTDNGRTSAGSVDPRPVNGATVHFAVRSDDGTVQLGTATTDATGVATIDWTLTPGGTLWLDGTGFGIGARPETGTDFGGFDALGNLPVSLETGLLSFEAFACDASAPALTQATVDGQIDGLDNYANADQHTVPVSLGGNNSSTGTLYVGNDCTNLYLAFVVEVDESNNNSLRFVFDNVYDDGESGDDNILSLERAGGGGWLFRDRYLSADCVGNKQSDCGPDDVTGLGRSDGMGAADWDADLGAFVYEMSFPLESGDSGHDFQRMFGEAIGYYLVVSLGNGSKGNTEWPDQRGKFKSYQQYVVQGPTVPTP